ncbi:MULTISPECIES: hypothetical protein [unclassified Blastococcus]
MQITEFGGPEVLDVVDLPDPVPGDGQQLFDVSTVGIDYADTHHRQSSNWHEPGRPRSCVVSQRLPAPPIALSATAGSGTLLSMAGCRDRGGARLVSP